MAFPLTIKSGFDSTKPFPWPSCPRCPIASSRPKPSGNRATSTACFIATNGAICNSLGNLAKGVRCFIARRGNTAQYAIVFRGSTLTSSGIEWTNLSYNNDDVMIPTSTRPACTTQGDRARVHRGMWQPFAVLRPEIELFFSVLTGHAMKPEVLVDLPKLRRKSAPNASPRLPPPSTPSTATARPNGWRASSPQPSGKRGRRKRR
ncbi:MAG: hypothetical protein R3A10_20450 [Caldilineaceae bacterium]